MNEKHSRFRKAMYITWIVYAIISCLVLTDIIRVPLLNQSGPIAYDLCWDKETGVCGTFLSTDDHFFEIPLYLTAPNRSTLVEHQEVIMSSSGGLISGNLAEGLKSVSIRYASSVPFIDRTENRVIFAFDGLSLKPSADAYAFMEMENSSALAGSDVSVMWQSEGEYYPTVMFNYQNYTSIPYPFPEAAIRVQSETEFNNSVIEYKLFVLGIAGAIPTVAESIHKWRKTGPYTKGQ